MYKIFIVEDDITIAQSVRKTLGKMGLYSMCGTGFS